MKGVRRLEREGTCRVDLVPKSKVRFMWLRTKTSDGGSEKAVMKFRFP